MIFLKQIMFRKVEALRTKLCKTSMDLREQSRGANTRSFDRSNSISADS